MCCKKQVEVFWRLGTRTNQRHVANENVPKLWEFVDLCLSQPSSESGNPRVVCRRSGRPERMANPHRADLVDLKKRTFLADPPLAEQPAAARIEPCQANC